MQDQQFWHNKWAANQIGFHLDEVNPLLIKYWQQTKPSRQDKVFVPLCGKSEDLVWLAQHHEDVQGVELSNIAVRAFFAEHFYTPLVMPISSQHELYQFDELSIYVGDYFSAPIEAVDIIYDRGALIALPKESRVAYVEKLKSLLKANGRILLVTLDYDQQLMSGPPFSVPEPEIKKLFQGFKITRLESNPEVDKHPKIAQHSGAKFNEEVYLIESMKC